MQGDYEKEIRKLVKEKDIPISRIPDTAFRKWTKEAHQGILAVMSIVEYGEIQELIERFESEEIKIALVLDHIKDVRNLGAVVRSAVCFGIKDIVVPARNTAEINEVVVKSSAGALLKARLYRTPNLPKAVLDIKDMDIKVYALEKKQGTSITTFSPELPFILVIGSEGHGVTKEILKLSNERLAIEYPEDFDSLNVSVATGIALYQLTNALNS
jgi:23S rRNA (guanosine2251-2'-O)-methyltransferase